MFEVEFGVEFVGRVFEFGLVFEVEFAVEFEVGG